MIPMPTVRDVIRRRILVNYRVDAEVLRRQLPAPFRPKLLDGYAVAGICLIRLEQLRPRLLPAAVGLASENAAHRVAVEWTEADGRTREGVYIQRRDSGSPVNRLLGGRLFPGAHHAARFDVRETADAIDLAVRSADGRVAVELRARPAAALPPTSRFPSLAAASAFFEAGAVGYSPRRSGELEGLRLATRCWRVEPLAVDHVRSSYFTDERRFPPGAAEFNWALVMRDVEHEWHALPRPEAARTSRV